MKNKKNWVIALILTAAAGFVAVQSNGTPAPIATTETAPLANTITVTDTPISPASASKDCAYTWAYHDAPELTDKVNAIILKLDPKADVHATLYGEDCVYADGHADFGVMETDFYVKLPVDDLTNEEFLGNWMAQVLPLILKIPRAEIKGNYGFVEFWFEKSETDHVVLRIPIQMYLDQAQGKSGAELYRMFNHPIPY